MCINLFNIVSSYPQSNVGEAEQGLQLVVVIVTTKVCIPEFMVKVPDAEPCPVIESQANGIGLPSSVTDISATFVTPTV